MFRLSKQVEIARFVDLKAATDYMGPGAIFMPEFDTNILDLMRQRGALGQRIRNRLATGDPTRWLEVSAKAGGEFVDKRTIAGSVGSTTRVEKYTPLKALFSKASFGLFDVEVNNQQGNFPNLVAGELQDRIEDILVMEDEKLWTGKVATAPLEYDGLLTLITGSFAIAKGESIVDGIRTKVASMVANKAYRIRPTAIYLDAILLDLLEQEVKNAANTMKDVAAREVEVVPGLVVRGLSTAAGILPLIPEPYLEASVSGADTLYKCAIVTENLIEYHYVTTPKPRMFKLGLVENLAGVYVVIKFGSPVVRGAGIAHSIGTVTR